MAENRGVAYMGTGKVEVQDIDFPTFELKDGPGVNPDNVGRKLPHAAILKVVSTNICGSDQHMVRGRTTAPKGLVLGHEITGEIIEKGGDVEYLNVGFNTGDGAFASVFFGLTGLHGAHVFVGLSLLLMVIIRGFRGHYSPEHHHGVELPGIYWHFVDVMWIVVYATVYLL